MSVSSVLSDIGGDLVKFSKAVAADWSKAKAAWNIISSPQTRSVIISVAQQAIKTVNDSAAALQGGGVNLTLDSAVVADIKTLLADAKAGEGVINADLAALGITL